MEENKQAICDYICAALQQTRQFGYPDANPLAELRYMVLPNGDEIVRPVLADGTGENGWYDVNVTWDSGVAMFIDIVKQFVAKM